jgi:hypothetical protein
MKNLYLIAFLLLNLNSIAQNQMRKWFIGPKSIDMPAGLPPAVTSLATINGIAPVQARSVANGIYDNNNELVFYVADKLILDKNNTILGSIPNEGAETVILPFEKPKSFWEIIKIKIKSLIN